MPRLPRVRFGTVCALSLLSVAGVQAGRATPPLTTPELLVDLARDYALHERGRQTAADVTHVRVLLEAATRLEPRCADAYAWLYELAVLDGNERDAARALQGLLRANPAHEGAFTRWLAAGLDAHNTVEERREWLAAVAATPRSPALEALVHVAMARLAAEQLDLDDARLHVARALELDSACVDAAALAVDLLDADATPAERLQAELRFLELAPVSVTTAWRVGQLLADYGFVEQAGRFYEHALAVHQRADPHAAVPAEFRLALAGNLDARGEPEAAIEQARAAARADPLCAAQAGMFLYYLLEKSAPGSGDDIRSQLGERFAALRDPAEYPVNEVAQAAWFYCTLDPQPDRARMLAAAAVQRAPGDAFARRVLGWAQALGGQTDDALATLRPIAGRDPFAAAAVARLLHEAGDDPAARRVLEQLEPKPVAGPAFDLLNSLPLETAASAAATQPAAEAARRRYPAMFRALLQFDERTLAFARDPGRFLEAGVRIEDPRLAPGEPWWAVFTLTSRAPFPITLGPEAMINPVFLLSFSVEGDRRREYPALLTINLGHVRVLRPGQLAQVRRTLDVGPLRRVARYSPQRNQRVTLRVILDPIVQPDGTWQPGPGGQELEPVYFNRLPLTAGRTMLARLFDALAATSPAAQVRAIDVLAQLLGERQRADAGHLEYEPAPVPADRIADALVELLRGDSWELCARTLDALQVAGLSRRMLHAAQDGLDHPHWLARLMALRLLARQGPAMSATMAELARTDPDELVRRLAQSYLDTWHEGPLGVQSAESEAKHPINDAVDCGRTGPR